MRGSRSFNSLSRDHKEDGTVEILTRGYVLSTPSLGITNPNFVRVNVKNTELSTPSLGITVRGTGLPRSRGQVTFNSLSRDHKNSLFGTAFWR